MTPGAVASDSGAVEDGAMMLRVEDRLPVAGRRRAPFDYYGDREWRLCSISNLMIGGMEWQKDEGRKINLRCGDAPRVYIIPQAYYGNLFPAQ